MLKSISLWQAEKMLRNAGAKSRWRYRIKDRHSRLEAKFKKRNWQYVCSFDDDCHVSFWHVIIWIDQNIVNE